MKRTKICSRELGGSLLVVVCCTVLSAGQGMAFSLVDVQERSADRIEDSGAGPVYECSNDEDCKGQNGKRLLSDGSGLLESNLLQELRVPCSTEDETRLLGVSTLGLPEGELSTP